MDLKQFGFVFLAAVLLAGFAPLAAAEENASGEATPSPEPTIEPTPEASVEPTATIQAPSHGRRPFAEVREQRIARLAETLKVRVQRAISVLENALERLEADGRSVDDLRIALAELRAAEARFDEAETLADLRAALRDVKEAHNALRDRIQERIREHAKNKVKNVIDRAKGLMDRIDAVIADLKAKGADTTAAEQKASEIRAKLAEAEGVYGQNVREAAHLLVQVKRMLLELKHALRVAAAQASGLPAPTAEPTLAPQATVEATPEATASPEATPEPTAEPSVEPTAEATASPTEEPVNQT